MKLIIKENIKESLFSLLENKFIEGRIDVGVISGVPIISWIVNNYIGSNEINIVFQFPIKILYKVDPKTKPIATIPAISMSTPKIDDE